MTMPDEISKPEDSRLQTENERLRRLLADWRDFAEDVGCADPAGKDWLYVLKGLTRAVLERKP